jgi:hypothetical protein
MTFWLDIFQVQVYTVYWLGDFGVGSSCRDRMVVGFTTTYAISAYYHWCCEFKSRSGRGVQLYSLYAKFCQWLATGRWFSPGPPVSSINKTERHDIAEILLKVTLNTIKKRRFWSMSCTEVVLDIFMIIRSDLLWGQAKDYITCICCFSTKIPALSQEQQQDRLALNQYSVT